MSIHSQQLASTTRAMAPIQKRSMKSIMRTLPDPIIMSMHARQDSSMTRCRREAPAGGSHPRDGAQPLEILRRRYAAGEIDRDEFEQRRRSLAESDERAR